jgi:hypothetical protein
MLNSIDARKATVAVALVAGAILGIFIIGMVAPILAIVAWKVFLERESMPYVPKSVQYAREQDVNESMRGGYHMADPRLLEAGGSWPAVNLSKVRIGLGDQ